MNNKSNLGITLCALIIIAFLSIRTCNMKKDNERQKSDLIALAMDKVELKKTIDDKNREITQASSVILDQSSVIAKQLSEIKGLKNLRNKVVFQTTTLYDSLIVEVHDTTFVRQTPLSTDTITAKSFAFNDGWITMKGIVESNTMRFDSLQIKNDFNIEIGQVKDHWWSKKRSVVMVRNENPHTSTNKLVSYEIKDGKKWYQKDVFKYLAGGLVVYLIRR